MVSKSSSNETEWQDPQSDSEWEDVPQEGQIVFEKVGDEYIGTFQGWSETERNAIPQAHFVGQDGVAAFLNVGASLKQQLKGIKKGTLCRLVWESERDTGQDSPMRVFRVQTKRA